MKKIFTITFILVFLVACGGSSYTPNPNPTGNAPTGNFSGQVDPVQTQ